MKANWSDRWDAGYDVPSVSAKLTRIQPRMQQLADAALSELESVNGILRAVLEGSATPIYVIDVGRYTAFCLKLYGITRGTSGGMIRDSEFARAISDYTTLGLDTDNLNAIALQVFGWRAPAPAGSKPARERKAA